MTEPTPLPRLMDVAVIDYAAAIGAVATALWIVLGMSQDNGKDNQ